MVIIRVFVTVFIFFLSILNAAIAASDTDPMLEESFSKIIHSKHRGQTVIREYKALEINPSAGAHFLRAKYKDPDPVVRREAYLAALNIHKHGYDTSIKKVIIEDAVKSLEDKDPAVWAATAPWLLFIKQRDYSENAKNGLSLLMNELFYGGDANLHLMHSLILLLGKLDMKSEIPILKEVIEKGTNNPNKGTIAWYGSLSWAALRALARMGDQGALAQCLHIARTEENAGAMILKVIPDLAYVRQPAMANFLVQQLKKEAAIPAISDAFAPTFAQASARSLAEMLDGFPMDPGALNCNEDMIHLCRDWADKQKGWKFRE